MTIDGAAARKILLHLLAALVLVHVVTAVFVGLGPVPTSDVANSRKALQHVADTMRLDDGDRFIALVDRVGGAWNGARTGTRKAMDPLWRHLGTAQHWRMFSGTIRGTARVEIAVRTGDGAWEDVYVQGSRETLWRHHTFDHYRWREYGKSLSSKRRTRPFKLWVAWAAPRLFDDFPEATEARFRVMVGRVPRPGGERAGPRYDLERRSRIVARNP